jgi:type II secretory pathway pseudopilin PulG
MASDIDMIRSPRHGSGGFTLIELMIIIAILGLLGAIVVYAVQGSTQTSAASACRSDYKAVESAQEAYRGQVGAYATTVSQLLVTATGVDGQLDGPWLKEAPGNTAHYLVSIDNGTIPRGTKGNVTVASVSPAHLAQDGNANCAFA